MPEYNCECCNYFTKIKTQYLRHLKSQKHQRLSYQYTPKSENIDKILKNLHISPHFSTFSPHFSTFINDKSEPKSAQIKCRFCRKTFSRTDSLQRHLKESCKAIEECQEKDKQYEDLFKLLEKEREVHKEQLEKVLAKVGHTTINNQTTHLTQNNTLNINNYGSENLSMLTDKFMKKMISFPYTAIPKLIKKIHFNDNYPENMNIRMLNKRDGKLQILKQNKWIYVDKKDHIAQLIDEKNYILDQYYEDNKLKLNGNSSKRFHKYKANTQENNTDIKRENNKHTELVFWNSM